MIKLGVEWSSYNISLTNTTVVVAGHHFLDSQESVSQTEVRGGDNWGLAGYDGQEIVKISTKLQPL